MNQITEFAKVTSHNNSASWPMEKKGFDFFLYLTSPDPLPLNPEDRELPKRAGSVQEIGSCNHFQNPGQANREDAQSSTIISSFISRSDKDRALLQEIKANGWAVFLRASSFSSQQLVCFLWLKKKQPNHQNVDRKEEV